MENRLLFTLTCTSFLAVVVVIAIQYYGTGLKPDSGILIAAGGIGLVAWNAFRRRSIPNPLPGWIVGLLWVVIVSLGLLVSVSIGKVALIWIRQW